VSDAKSMYGLFHEFHFFTQRAFCAYCNDRIWGLGRQGFKCTQCKLLVHKKCHKLVRILCSDASTTLQSNSSTSSRQPNSAESSMFLEEGHEHSVWSSSGRHNGDSTLSNKSGIGQFNFPFIRNDLSSGKTDFSS